MKDITTEEAVRMLKNLKKECEISPYGTTNAIAIEKVLNELDTLQNGFNTAVEHQSELIRENSHLRYELFNNQTELEKKDKIIDAMFHEYEYNARINIKDYCDDEIRKDACIQDCENCIKQYFERKAKDERI